MEGSGLSKGHVQDHHDQEAGHDAEGAPMGLMVVAKVGLWNELLHHHIEHSSGGKGDHIDFVDGKDVEIIPDEDYADLTKEEKKKYENIKIDRIVFARKEEKVLHYNLSV